MSQGNPVVNFRLPADLKERLQPLRMAVPMASVFRVLVDLWEQNPDARTFLMALGRRAVETDRASGEPRMECLTCPCFMVADCTECEYIEEALAAGGICSHYPSECAPEDCSRNRLAHLRAAQDRLAKLELEIGCNEDL